MMRTVTIVPPTINHDTSLPIGTVAKRKVAAYARVSTDKDEQLSSYEAQCDYYTRFIQSRPDWEFVAIYSDEGVTGTSTTKREGFQAMVRDALEGKINLIVTKSVSRFARNTMDSLSTIWKLKECGTEVYFENEIIWTFDSKGEILLTILSSLSQEESRSISENVKWGQSKKFSDGKFSLNYSHFLGYDKGEGGTLKINPEQAKVVKRIYSEFLSGRSVNTIARGLTLDGIPTPTGLSSWWGTTVRSILQNEKYKGCALLQKTYTPDFLTKKATRNNGEVPMYYIEDSHEAIIDPERFELVQEMLKEGARGTKSVFGGKVRCGDCGGAYSPKVWHSTDKYRKVIWQCNEKFTRSINCRTPTLKEEEIKEAFLRAVNEILSKKEHYISGLNSVLEENADLSVLEAERKRLDNQLGSDF